MSDIRGHIVLADMVLNFSSDEDLMVDYTIELIHEGCASMRVPQAAFLKALAIAVHNDGMPDYNADYPDAESAMPRDPRYRWIP